MPCVRSGAGLVEAMPDGLSSRAKLAPRPNVKTWAHHEATEGHRNWQAMTLGEDGLRRTVARGGAQAIEGALHADRRVQQYGPSLNERSVTQWGRLGRDRCGSRY